MTKKMSVREDLAEALFRASRDGNLHEIARLLDSGADPTMSVNMFELPLHAAAREGHIDAVRLLLDRGCDVNLPDPLE